MSNVTSFYTVDTDRIAAAMLATDHEAAYRVAGEDRHAQVQRLAEERAAKRRLIGIRAVDKSDVLTDDGPVIYSAAQAANRKRRAAFMNRWLGETDDRPQLRK